MLWSCTRATIVFSSLTASFFYCCHHLVHKFVGEWAACIPHEVFSKLLAAFKELYDHVIAFEFDCFDIIFPSGKEARALFARSCRWYGWSPHFLSLSSCLCSRLTSGLHMCALRVDCKKYSGKFVFYIFFVHLLSRYKHLCFGIVCFPCGNLSS